MPKAAAQLWGGPQDGLHASVEVGTFGKAPDFVDVPERPAAIPLHVFPKADAGNALDGVETVRYRLDPKYKGTELLYRLEPALRA